MGNELFKNIPSKVGDLVKDVRNGRIGLPDLQRPFVWKDNKVRELFDSMLKGYPIGYIMLWESPADYESKKSTIGDNSKTYEEPKELVIDGQQRLTALVAAMFAVKQFLPHLPQPESCNKPPAPRRKYKAFLSDIPDSFLDRTSVPPA